MHKPHIHSKTRLTPLHAPVYVHVPRLSNAVAAVLSLCVHCGIPVTVIKDDRICPCKVHPYTSTARRQDEAENAPVHVKPFHQHLERRDSSDESPASGI